jgi:hypothetical protein
MFILSLVENRETYTTGCREEMQTPTFRKILDNGCEPKFELVSLALYKTRVTRLAQPANESLLFMGGEGHVALDTVKGGDIGRLGARSVRLAEGIRLNFVRVPTADRWIQETRRTQPPPLPCAGTASCRAARPSRRAPCGAVALRGLEAARTTHVCRAAEDPPPARRSWRRQMDLRRAGEGTRTGSQQRLLAKRGIVRPPQRALFQLHALPPAVDLSQLRRRAAAQRTSLGGMYAMPSRKRSRPQTLGARRKSGPTWQTA